MTSPDVEIVDLPPDPPATAAPVVRSDETQAIRELWKLAGAIKDTEFVPRSLRGKEDKVLASMVSGRELGLGPMTSLKHITVIDGRPHMSAAVQLALVRQHGHKVTGSADSRKAEITGIRADNDDQMTVTWDLEKALKAGLIDKIDEDGHAVKRSQNGNPLPWELYTQKMLWARAATDLVSMLFPDVVVGGLPGARDPHEYGEI